MDLAFGTERTNELLVLLILAILGKTTKTGGATVERLGGLVESLFESIVDKSLLEDLLVCKER